jgi:hypoxanthine phosphoribosyltransferase
MISDNPYDYENRHGVHPVSWEEFHGLCKGLAMVIAAFQPEIILPVGRGGFYPGTLISHLLRCEVYPIRLSRRVDDKVVYSVPKWIVKPPTIVKGCRALIVDEISSSGETISIAKAEILSMGAAAVKSAVLYAHTWGSKIPDYIGLITDELLLNPWDREIYHGGEFRFNPEYLNALDKQGLELDSLLLMNIPASSIAKV